MGFSLIVSAMVLLTTLCMTPSEALVTEFTSHATFRKEVYDTDAVWMILFHNPDYAGTTPTRDALRDEFAILATELAADFRFGMVDVTLAGGATIADSFNAINEGVPLIKVILYEDRDLRLNLSLNGGLQDIATLRVALGKVKPMLGRRSDLHGYYTKRFFADPRET